MTTQRVTRSINARAPAKINLGLEILGKRRDGYHEIRSILTMVDLYDDLHFQFGQRSGATSIDGVPAEHNLIDRAVRLMQSRCSSELPFGYQVEKRIPIATGLGGASSDAAATLVAVNHLLGHPFRHDYLIELAASLGSDVPFFLDGSTAYVKGTGTDITTIPGFTSAVLLVVPNIVIPRKTPTLYGRITAGDHSAGDRIDRTVGRLRAGLPPEPDDLHNAFMAPLYDLVPPLAIVPTILRESGCVRFGLSGAGPAHYALVDAEEIASVASRIRTALDPHLFRLYHASLLPNRGRLQSVS